MSRWCYGPGNNVGEMLWPRHECYGKKRIANLTITELVNQKLLITLKIVNDY